MTTLEDELRSQISMVPFVELEPFVSKGVVVVVDQSLELAKVAVMFANDSKADVAKLLEDGRLAKANHIDLRQWRYEKRFFNVLIVQPFVLVQTAITLNGDLNN
jgi:hypothetical protein